MNCKVEIMVHVAQCSCNSVKVVTDGEPSFIVACHCIDCQRRTGSVFGVGAYFPSERVSVSGVTREYVRAAEPWNHFYFCPVCGSTTHWYSDKDAGLVGIAVGAFGEPTFGAPIRSVWEQSKHDWVDVTANQHFPEGRQ